MTFLELGHHSAPIHHFGTRQPPNAPASVVHQTDGELTASADLARVTFARMSQALAVQMKGFGAKLCSSM